MSKKKIEKIKDMIEELSTYHKTILCKDVIETLSTHNKISLFKDLVEELSTHDKMILEAISWAKSLGCGVERFNLGRRKGPDAVFSNPSGDKVILEIELHGAFNRLFKQTRIRENLIQIGSYKLPEFCGLIVIGSRIDNMRKQAEAANFPSEHFEPKTQKIFMVQTHNFKEHVPLLLISLLGSRASK